MTAVSFSGGVRIRVSGARGPRGLPSGPLGAGSVDAETISDSSPEQEAIREKIGAGPRTFSHTDASAGDDIVEKLKREVHVEDAPWLANNVLIVDKAAKIQEAIDFVSALGGGTVKYGYSGDSYTFADGINLRRNVTLQGPTGRADPGNPFAGRTGFYAALAVVPKLILGSGASIMHEGAGCLQSCYILREGTPTDGTADPADFEGTAILTGATDAVAIRDCSILGFEFAAQSTGTARIIWADVLIDCNNGPRQETSYDKNTYSSVHCYGVLQGDVGPTSALTLRSGSAFYLGGTFNGGPTLFNCFEYGFNVGFNVACPGSYKFVACWADGPHNAGTGRPLDPNSVGIYCVSASPAHVVAEPQFVGITVSAKGNGMVLGGDIYGASLIIGAHIYLCNVCINCSAENVVFMGALRSYFDGGIIFNSPDAAYSAKIPFSIFYNPQVSSTFEINCGFGEPLLTGTARADGSMRLVNVVPFRTTRDNAGLVIVPDNRQTFEVGQITASFTGSISGTTLTVTATSGGRLVVGSVIAGSGVTVGTKIVGKLTGKGLAGTYIVDIPQTAASQAMTGTHGSVGAIGDFYPRIPGKVIEPVFPASGYSFTGVNFRLGSAFTPGADGSIRLRCSADGSQYRELSRGPF